MNLNGFMKLPNELGGGYLRYQRSPSSHYGGTCFCDGWHISAAEVLADGFIELKATDVQRHGHYASATATIGAGGSASDDTFPWYLVKPVRVWPKHLQTRRRRTQALRKGQGQVGPFVLVRQDGFDMFSWEAVLASTGERVLQGHRRALIRAIESGRLNAGARFTQFAHWLSAKSDEWKFFHTMYGG